MTRAKRGTHRRAIRVLLALLTLGTLVIPPVVVATSGTATYSATWTALRMLALYALTVVFINIMTGSFRPLLVKAFKPKFLFRLHNTTGLVGFSMARRPHGPGDLRGPVARFKLGGHPLHPLPPPPPPSS